MNGIYLYLLLKEIRGELLGKFIEDVRIRWRIVELVLNQYSLVVSLHPTVLGMYLTKRSASDYRSVKAVAEPLKSCRVIDVLQEGCAPVMRMIVEKEFPGKEQLEVIVSFYHEAPNLSLRTRTWQKNIFARFIQKKVKSSILDFDDRGIASMDAESIVQNIEGVDIKMARSLDARNIKIVRSVITGKTVHPKLVSLQPLCVSLFDAGDSVEYNSFNALFKHVIQQFSATLDDKYAEQERRLRMRRLKKRKARLQKKLLTTEEVESLRHFGEMILANMKRINKGDSSVELINPYTKRIMTLKLDPRLAPQANAQKYFQKYKKAKKGQPKLREQIGKVEKEIGDVDTAPESLRVDRQRGITKSIKRELFHKFNLASGSIVFVGKNAKSNDQLTFQQARSGDYFFHARGVEGAHTILRPNIPKRQRPGKDEIRTAAAIAAYYSKARTQRNVPVSFTQRKYLKKDKKGRPGSVIMMREEVIFVDPALPT